MVPYLCSLIHVKVDGLEVLNTNLTSASLVTLIDEFHNILLRWCKWQVLSKNLLKITSCDEMFSLLIKESEAFGGFSVFAWFTKSFEPVICNNMLAEGEINSVAISDLWIALSEFFLDVSWSHFVEAKVLQNVLEEMVWNPSLSLLVIAIKALLEIIEDLHWKLVVAWLDIISDLCNVQLLLDSSRFLLCA